MTQRPGGRLDGPARPSGRLDRPAPARPPGQTAPTFADASPTPHAASPPTPRAPATTQGASPSSSGAPPSMARRLGVYRAWEPSRSAEVALKVLRRLEARAAQRFAREAAAPGKLRHPNIDESGIADGKPFLVEELVAGQPLSRLCASAGLEPRRAARLVRDGAEAIEHAHQEGVLHRDLKPSNVVVDAQGR